MIRSIALVWLGLGKASAAQEVGFFALQRYAEACHILKAAFLNAASDDLANSANDRLDIRGAAADTSVT